MPDLSLSHLYYGWYWISEDDHDVNDDTIKVIKILLGKKKS